MTRPNIIYIVADDLGYADLGCYGGREGRHGPVSPVIDRLAAQGMLFTDGYANSSVCSPTRYAMITGQYQYRYRGAAEEPMAASSFGSEVLGLHPAVPTLPSMLREVGYNTALIGKWHLGHLPAFGPLKSGYDEFYGATGGGLDYFTHKTSNGYFDLWQGEEPCHDEGYLTDLFSQRAVDFVRRKADDARAGKPFLLSLHYTAPHWPWETRDDAGVAQEVAGKLFHLHGGSIHTYQRMIQHMDEGIGWIVAELEAQGLLNDTLIVFTSDNGGERFSDNWPLVGGKMDLTEGGIRVPYVVHWPAMIAPGQVSNQHCLTMDWTATMLAAAGAQVPETHPLDGVSLLPVLSQAQGAFERPLAWRMKHRGQRAFRLGDWKYLKVDEHEYLFNLVQDARERANLAEHLPERFQAMKQAWLNWDATMPEIPPDATVTLGYSARNMP